MKWLRIVNAYFGRPGIRPRRKVLFPLILLGTLLLSLTEYIVSEYSSTPSWLVQQFCVTFICAAGALLLNAYVPFLYKWHLASTSRTWKIISESLPALGIVVCLCIIHRRLFLGDIPYSYDHPVQILNGWIMSDKLLATGRLNGWVHDRGLGFPAGILYPQGAYYLMAVVKRLMLSDASFDRVYAYSFLISMAIWHLALYATGRLVKNITTGIIAGVLSMVDPGVFLQGGHSFAIDWGVWPSCVASGLCLLGSALFYRAISHNHRTALAVSALVSGIAITFHPISLVYLGASFALATVHAIVSMSTQRPLRIVANGLLAAALTVGVAALWLLPFLAYRQYSVPLSTGAVMLEQQITGFLSLTFFGNMWAMIIAAGVLGGIVAFLRNQYLLKFFVLLLILFTFLSSSLSFESLWKPLTLDIFISRLQPGRFYLYTRPIAFLCAGYAMDVLLRKYIRVAGNRTASTWRRYASLLLTASICGVFVVPLWRTAYNTYVKPSTTWTRRPDTWNNYMEVAEFLRNRSQPRAGIFRSMWDRYCPGNPHHCYEDAPAYSRMPQYFPAHHSGATFRGFFTRPDSANPYLVGANLNETVPARRAGNVRFIVTVRDTVPGANRQVFASGPLRVFEDITVKPDAPFHVEGRARAKLKAFRNEFISLELSDVTPDAFLVLHVFEFCNWHAFLNGKEIPIQPWKARNIEQLMRVKTDQNGLLEFRYVRGVPEKISPWITLLALFICGGIIGRKRITPAGVRILSHKVVSTGRRIAGSIRSRIRS